MRKWNAAIHLEKWNETKQIIGNASRPPRVSPHTETRTPSRTCRWQDFAARVSTPYAHEKRANVSNNRLSLRIRHPHMQTVRVLARSFSLFFFSPFLLALIFTRRGWRTSPTGQRSRGERKKKKKNGKIKFVCEFNSSCFFFCFFYLPSPLSFFPPMTPKTKSCRLRTGLPFQVKTF